MKRIITIVFLLIIMFSSFIYAEAPTDWHSRYDFEDNSVNGINKTWNWTNNGGTFDTGLSGDGIKFNGANAREYFIVFPLFHLQFFYK